jgi:hypothetical protein
MRLEIKLRLLSCINRKELRSIPLELIRIFRIPTTTELHWFQWLLLCRRLAQQRRYRPLRALRKRYPLLKLPRRRLRILGPRPTHPRRPRLLLKLPRRRLPIPGLRPTHPRRPRLRLKLPRRRLPIPGLRPTHPRRPRLLLRLLRSRLPILVLRPTHPRKPRLAHHLKHHRIHRQSRLRRLHLQLRRLLQP